MRAAAALPILLLLTLSPEPLLAQGEAPESNVEVEIREWTVPWPDTRPRDPFVAPDGDIWFVGQRADYTAELDPATGEFERIDLPDGTGPHTVIVDDAGVLWIAGNRDAYIGRLDPDVGTVERIEMPNGHPRDPHSLAQAPGGAIWFTAQGANVIGRLDPETREVDIIEVATEQARPYGIVVTEEGRPWVAMVGTNKLATVDPGTMELREVTLPAEGAAPRRIALGEDGGVWYVDYARGYLGRYDPATGAMREWAAPAGEQSRPYAMAADDQGRLWFVETGPEPNRLVGFDPATEAFFSITAIPSGGGAVRHMVFDPETRALWFGTDTNTIGRALVP